MDVVVVKFTNVHGVIGPLEGSRAMLLSILIVTFIASTIRPGLHSEPVLLVFSPFTSILCSVHMNICSLSVSFVVKPLAFVNVSI
jgi:hypothetical protein